MIGGLCASDIREPKEKFSVAGSCLVAGMCILQVAARHNSRCLHLSGNAAGYNKWSSSRHVKVRSEPLPTHISFSILREEYDSLRRIGGFGPDSRVPDELWRELSSEARYVLDRAFVSGTVFSFIDGLILRMLDLFDDPQHVSEVVYPHGVVTEETSSDRMPSVVIGKEISDLRTWLRMCRSGTFWLSANVPMSYYMLPVEAAITFSGRGKFGAICIESVR